MPLTRSLLSRIFWKQWMQVCMRFYAAKHTETRQVFGGNSVIPHPELFFELMINDNDRDALLARFPFLPMKTIDYDFDPSFKAPSIPIPRHEYENFHVHKEPDEDTKRILERTFESLRLKIENRLGYAVNILKVRFFEIRPGYTYRWHKDNFPPGIYKLLIYLTGASEAHGTTQIKIANKLISINCRPGGGLLFDSNNLEHVAVAPISDIDSKAQPLTTRITVEYTIGPSLIGSSNYSDPGLIATYPVFPPDYEEIAGEILDNESKIEKTTSGDTALKSQFKDNLLNAYVFRKKQYDSGSAKGLNVGAGPQFFFKDWEGLDGAFGIGNTVPFRFSPLCRFPYEDGEKAKVICSHTLEHLDDNTVARVLSEISRVSARDALFLVKIPAYDQFISDFLSDEFERWRFITSDVEQFWSVKSVAPNDHQRLSFALLNFWNKEYGKDHYTGVTPRQGAYFGPVWGVSETDLADIFRLRDPGLIVKVLRGKFTDLKDTNLMLAHQNAWSSESLNILISQYGFDLVTNTAEVIVELCSDWPKIRKHYQESSWHLFRKKF